MNDGPRRRFWVELGLALSNGVLVLLTIVWKNWIEIVFRVDPDANSGLLEWLIVVVALALTMTLAALAHHEWRRSAVNRPAYH